MKLRKCGASNLELKLVSLQKRTDTMEMDVISKNLFMHWQCDDKFEQHGFELEESNMTLGLNETEAATSFTLVSQKTGPEVAMINETTVSYLALVAALRLLVVA